MKKCKICYYQEKHDLTNEGICKHITSMQGTEALFDFIYTKTLKDGCEYFRSKGGL